MKEKKVFAVFAVILLIVLLAPPVAFAITDEYSDGFETGAIADFWTYEYQPSEEGSGHNVTSDSTYVRTGTYGVNSTNFDYPQQGGYVLAEIANNSNHLTSSIFVKPKNKFTDDYSFSPDTVLGYQFYNSSSGKLWIGVQFAVMGNTTGYYVSNLYVYDQDSGIYQMHTLNSPQITIGVWSNFTLDVEYTEGDLIAKAYLNDTLLDTNTLEDALYFSTTNGSHFDLGFWGRSTGFDDFSASFLEAPPSPSPTPTPSPPIPGVSVDYYFRSDLYVTLGVLGYGLDADYTNMYFNVSNSFPVYYGFRVWLISSINSSTELTSGAPSAIIYLDGSETYGTYGAIWACPETAVILGFQALKISMYLSADGSEWTALVNYVSPLLITTEIENSEWTFTIQVLFDAGDAVYSWGDSAHRSGVSGIEMTTPRESEIQLWRINTGDYIGFILGAYIDVIGEAFYVLCLIGAAGTLYFRYRNFGVIAFFFAIFGGVGGLVWFLVPPWAAAVTSALIIVGTSFLVWRVIR